MSKTRLTIPDLVVLTLLKEQPMHGYAVVCELEQREVADWAGISRPQVYYSLNKLAERGLIKAVSDKEDPAGPARCVYGPTNKALKAVADALARQDWATQRPPPPFLTWVALSAHAQPGSVKELLRRRGCFLKAEIRKEQATLVDLAKESAPGILVAASMVRFAIQQFEAERLWLNELASILLED